MQLGIANQVFNSRMPGAAQYGRNIQSSGETAFNNASKYATDASQLLGVNAGIQGQTDQQLNDLQLQEADWTKFGLNNLNEAYGAMTNEDRYMNELDQQKYENEVAIQGARAANKLAKRQALWNTVGGIANLGTSVLTGGIKLPKFGGGGKGGGTQATGSFTPNPWFSNHPNVTKPLGRIGG